MTMLDQINDTSRTSVIKVNRIAIDDIKKPTRNSNEKDTLIRWDHNKHVSGTFKKIDGKYEVIDTPDKIKVQLFEPQKISVAAMLRLENKDMVWLKHNTHGPRWSWVKNINKLYIKSNIGILSSPLGSGKTLMILSLIAHKPIPHPKPNVLSTFGIYNPFDTEKIYKTLQQGCPVMNITKRYTKLIKPALIFSGRPALKQWLWAIETQTHLKALIVKDVRDLVLLKNALDDGSVNNYDVVLVKNGTIVSRVIVENIFPKKVREPINTLSSKELYNVICNMTRDRCWSRVIIDDFDTIKFPEVFGHMNALFTWYVSCTRKKGLNLSSYRRYKSHSPISMDKTPSIESYLYNTYLSYPQLIHLDIVFDNFNICCTDAFIKKTIVVGNPKFYSYTIINPNNKLIGALGAMRDEKVTQIFEMLNADAMEEAATQAGIASVDTQDIFQKILENKYDQWDKSRRILKFIKIERVPVRSHFRLHMDLNPNQQDTYGKMDLRVLRLIKYKYPGLHNLFVNEHAMWLKIKVENGKSIERVQNNLQANVCAICSCSLVAKNINEQDDDIDDFMLDMLGDLDDIKDDGQSKSVIMMKCCGITLCSECGIKGSNFRRTTWYKNKRLSREIIAGLCSNCKIEIQFKDLIFINKDFDHDNIIMENIEKKEVQEEEKVVTVTKSKPKKRAKVDVLIDIINGIKPHEQKSINKIVPSLMVGTSVFPPTPKKDVKVLIFSNYDESLNNVESQLKKQDISYNRLGGTAEKIFDVSILYNNTNKLNVLLVNSVKYCASLNLQATTDVVFMHKILDSNIESQTIGRAQRIGRKYELNIHYILYDNENAYL